EDPLSVRRIDPRVMWILAAGGALERAERLAAVGRSIHGGGDRINDVGVLRIHPDAGAIRALAVGYPRIVASHVLPRGTLIVGAIETGAALERAADDVDAFTIGMHRDRDADAAVVLRQRVYLLPSLARVGRFVERGAVRSLWRTACASSEASTEAAASA